MKIKVNWWPTEYWGFFRPDSAILWVNANRLQELHNALDKLDQKGCIASDRKLRSMLRKAIA
jgi:hypothetical protein